MSKIKCPDCSIGNLPGGQHKCKDCDKFVHIIYNGACSVRVAGEEGSNDTRQCYDCNEKENTKRNKKITWAYIAFKENNYGNFSKFEAVNISYIFKSKKFEECINPLHDTDFIVNKKYPFKHCKCIDESCNNGKTCPRFDTCLARIQYLGVSKNDVLSKGNKKRKTIPLKKHSSTTDNDYQVPKKKAKKPKETKNLTPKTLNKIENFKNDCPINVDELSDSTVDVEKIIETSVIKKSKTFNINKSKVKKRLQYEENEKEKEFECDSCKAVFCQKTLLIIHINNSKCKNTYLTNSNNSAGKNESGYFSNVEESNTSSTHFLCDLCGIIFDHKRSLRMHLENCCEKKVIDDLNVQKENTFTDADDAEWLLASEEKIVVNCHCNELSKLVECTRDSKYKGRYFFKCQKSYSDKSKCKFFQWVDEGKDLDSFIYFDCVSDREAINNLKKLNSKKLKDKNKKQKEKNLDEEDESFDSDENVPNVYSKQTGGGRGGGRSNFIKKKRIITLCTNVKKSDTLTKDDEILEALKFYADKKNEKDEYGYTRYQPIVEDGEDKIYMGFNVKLDVEAYGLMMAKDPKKFFYSLVALFWDKQKLGRRCQKKHLCKTQVRTKSGDIVDLKVLTPSKKKLTFSLFNDYLMAKEQFTVAKLRMQQLLKVTKWYTDLIKSAKKRYYK